MKAIPWQFLACRTYDRVWRSPQFANVKFTRTIDQKNNLASTVSCRCRRFLKASDRQIADTIIATPHPHPKDEAKRHIAKYLKHLVEKHSKYFVVASERRLESGLVWIIELHNLETEHSVAELNYQLAYKVWGKGYISKALCPMLKFGFEILSLNRIHAYHLLRNFASQRVLQKNGV